ncbi:MAG TPA: M13 family metallopeptidase [Bryobacteraceae bacterium]|nr:M13 family metallopeptidase [Bryobacteraceae bacterium]
MHKLRFFFVAVALVVCAPQSSYASPASSSGIDLKAMDTTVSPCQNFYQYACAAWRRNNPIPPDQSRWGRFDQLLENNLVIEREILEKAANAGTARVAIEQKIGDYYAACMDEPAIEVKGIQPIAEILKEIDAIASNEDLVKEIVHLHNAGVRPFFNFNVRPDAKNASQEIATVDQGGLGLPDRDYYLKTDAKSVELRKQYEEHIRAMLGLLAKAEGASDADAEAKAHAIVNVETGLAKASMDRVARRNPDNTYHKMTVGELALLTPDFDWKRYISTVGIPHIESLNVASPDFVKALNTTLRDTSLADIKTYLTWQVLLYKADYLPHAFEAEDFHFFEHILRGTEAMPPRWKSCVRSTDRSLGEALGQEFVKVAFSGASKEKALALVGQIEAEMRKDIESAAWMTTATKQQAFAKLRAVTNKIGYPDKWRDYSSVRIIRGDHFGNALRAEEFEIRRNFNKIGKLVDKGEWTMTPPTVNAYYSPLMNNINFPAGILQPPFYSVKAADAVNYGGIGAVIGHELTHGFDDSGRRFDGDGNLHDWWTAEDAKAFESRADCIASEYSNFSPVPGVKLNGKLTLGENTADNGGVRLAYMALMDSLAGHVLEKTDGFTPQQQFFLGYAQIWCQNTTEQAARARAITDPHSPGEFRVNGVLQNVPEFGEAFSCKIGEPMVAAHPCRVW